MLHMGAVMSLKLYSYILFYSNYRIGLNTFMTSSGLSNTVIHNLHSRGCSLAKIMKDFFVVSVV